MDNAEAFKALKQVLDRGQEILKHQPVVRETCEAWTRSAREAFAAIWGPTADELKELTAARRKIMTNFDTDPSYYLTQVVANLHREIKVIDKHLKQKEEAARKQGTLANALPKLAVVVWAPTGAAATQDVAAAVAKGNLEPVVVEGEADLLARIMTLATLRYAVVVSPGGGNGAMAAEAAFAAGCLAGRLGPSRVALLLASPQKLPPAMKPLRALDLADTKRWQDQLHAELQRITK